MHILFEDNHLLIIDKPANWVVQGALPQQESLFDWATAYLKTKYSKPGNVFLGVVSRLDSVVTGVVPYARTSKAAARLSEQFRENRVRKRYVAIVESRPTETSGRLEHWLVRREKDTVTRVTNQPAPDAQKGILEYRVLGENAKGAELEISLITGRKHQIRAQLGFIGCSILGDEKYGSHSRFPKGIALHCLSLDLEHPTLKTPMHFVANIPSYWNWRSELASSFDVEN